MGESKQAKFAVVGARVIAVLALSCFALNTIGCASAPAFSKLTPGVATLEQESSWYYDDAEVAMAGASTSKRPSLGLRVANLFDTYTVELGRAEDAASALLPRAFKIASVVLPLSGTVGGLVLPSSVATTVSTTAGSATSLLAISSLFYDPSEGLHRAETCAEFLRNALDSLGQRWNRDELDTIEDTPEQWQIYLAMRSGLDAGRHASCPDPKEPREWWSPWGDDPPEEPDMAADAKLTTEPLRSEVPIEAQIEPDVSVEMDPLEIDAAPVEAHAVPTQVQDEISVAPEVVEERVGESLQEGTDQLPVEATGVRD